MIIMLEVVQVSTAPSKVTNTQKAEGDGLLVLSNSVCYLLLLPDHRHPEPRKIMSASKVIPMKQCGSKHFELTSD